MSDSLANGLGGSVLSAFCCFAYLIPIVIGVAGLVVWIIALIDVVQRPDAEFPSARQGAYNSSEKVIWVLVVVLAGVIGAIVYYAVVMRPYPRMRYPAA